MADDEDEHDDGEVGGHVQAPAHAVVHHDLAAAPDQSELSTSAPSVPQPVVQSRRRPLLGPSPG